MSMLGTIFKMANSPPRITARRGGRAIKKILRSIRFSRGRGGVPIDGTRNTTPAPSIKEASRHFLGDAATPPRGDARRGIRSFQYETPNLSLSRPRWTRLSTISATLTWTAVPRRRGNLAVSKSFQFIHTFFSRHQQPKFLVQTPPV